MATLAKTNLEAARDDFYGRLAPEALAPLWKVLSALARRRRGAALSGPPPEEFLAGRPLTAEEHRQLLDRDIPGMFAAGAHPFLLYTFTIKVNGFSFQMMIDYVTSLADIDPPLDIST